MLRAKHGLIGCLIGCVLAVLAMPAAADQKGADKKPATTLTQTLGADTYKQMEVAQKAFEAKDYKGAEAALDVLKAKQDKLNDFERATLWNLYAAVYRSADDNRRAVEAYGQVLRQNNLPEGLRDNALFALAQTLFLMEDYKKSIAVMERWFAVVKDVQPDAYVLLAQAHYQLQDYEGAKKPLVTAMGIARQRNQPWQESWLGLLRAIFFEQKDYAHATKVMEVLVSEYPKGTYFQQLSGLYGMEGNQVRQLRTLYAAYLGDFLGSPSDLLNLARLCMAQGVPERGVEVLERALKNRQLDASVDNLQLLAQALSMARDTGRAIPVLDRLSQMSGLAKHYVYLGQAYSEDGRWSQAASAFASALKGKELENPATVQMQLGTALFNDGKLQQAREAFAQATASPTERVAADNWIKFIDGQVRHDHAGKPAA